MSGLSRVRGRVSEADYAASRILLGLDFDGTLSRIVDRPEKAALSPRTRRLLERLIRRRDTKVAVLSGRALADIKRRVGLPGAFYAGDHGLQIDGPGFRWTHPRAKPLDAALLGPLEEDLKGIPGALIERKPLGFAVHFRRVPGPHLKRLAARLRARLAGLPRGLRLLQGKKTLDVRSSAAWDKGRALEAIRGRLAGDWKCVFIGDDLTDEEGFRTLGAGALTIRVGRARSSAAQFVLPDRRQVDPLLESLAARPAPPRGP